MSFGYIVEQSEAFKGKYDYYYWIVRFIFQILSCIGVVKRNLVKIYLNKRFSFVQLL